jgi:hypothetical protein
VTEVKLRHVSNVLTEEKKHQVIALGRLGWSLRRIERVTGVRRETAAGYLKTAGINIRLPGAWGRRPPDSKPANEVIPDSGCVAQSANEVISDSGADLPKPQATPSASEPLSRAHPTSALPWS